MLPYTVRCDILYLTLQPPTTVQSYRRTIAELHTVHCAYPKVTKLIMFRVISTSSFSLISAVAAVDHTVLTVLYSVRLADETYIAGGGIVAYDHPLYSIIPHHH